jgi:hypothetical protein
MTLGFASVQMSSSCDVFLSNLYSKNKRALIYPLLTPFLCLLYHIPGLVTERNVQRKMNVTARENGIVSVSADTGYQPNMQQHENKREQKKG